MIIYWTMLISVVFIGVVGCKNYSDVEYKQMLYNEEMLGIPQKRELSQQSISMGFAYLTFSFFIFFAGYRTNIMDSFPYQIMFNEIPAGLGNVSEIISSGKKGPGFDVLCCVFKTFISTDYTVWFFFLCIFQMTAVIKFLQKYSPIYWLSAYIFFTDESMTWCLNGIRQFTAVSILIFGFDFIVKRKMIPFLIFVFLAYTVHSSALLWLPAYFIINMKPWDKKFLFLVALAVGVLIFLINYTDLLNDTMNEVSGNKGMSDFVSSKNGSSFFRTIVLGIPAGIAFYYRKDIEALDPPPFVRILINMSVITVAISVLANFTNGLTMGRLPIYFQFGTWVLVAWIMENVLSENDRKNILTLIVFMYLVYFWKYTDGYIYESAKLKLKV